MNKKILLTTILAVIAVGVTSAYAAIDLKDDTTVTGNLAVTGDITGPTITALTAAISSAPICPAQNVVHWDKIMFHPLIQLENFFENDPQFMDSTGNSLYDIKVLDDPNTVADLNQKVLDKLEILGYGVIGQPGSVGTLLPIDVFVVDVDYSIVCTVPP